MKLEQCPVCGLDLAIGEQDLYEGLCKLCADRKAAETTPKPSAGQDRLVES